MFGPWFCRSMGNRAAPDWLVRRAPLAFLAAALVASGYILWGGADLLPYDYVTILTASAYIMAIALPVNWIISSTLVRRFSVGWRARAENMFFCAGICLVVVGAGLCSMLGTDVVDAAGGPTDAPALGIDLSPEAGQGDSVGGESTQGDRGTNILLVAFFVLVTLFIVIGMWWYNRTLAWRENVETYSRTVRKAAKWVVLKQGRCGRVVSVELVPGASERLGRTITGSRSMEYANYLQATCWQFAWTPPRQTGCGSDSRIDVWLQAGLAGGIRYLSGRCPRPVVSRDAEAYYAVYFNVVESIAKRLHETFVAGGNLGPDEIPSDLLTAANLMAVEIADVFYRADMSSLVKRGGSAKPSIFKRVASWFGRR